MNLREWICTCVIYSCVLVTLLSRSHDMNILSSISSPHPSFLHHFIYLYLSASVSFWSASQQFFVKYILCSCHPKYFTIYSKSQNN